MKKKFVLILKNKQIGSLKKELLEQHISHLKKLSKEEKLFICGPFKNNDSAIQILIAENIEEAKVLSEKDPFIKEKYYKNYDLYELIEANDSNNWLISDNQTKENLKENL